MAMVSSSRREIGASALRRSFKRPSLNDRDRGGRLHKSKLLVPRQPAVPRVRVGIVNFLAVLDSSIQFEKSPKGPSTSTTTSLSTTWIVELQNLQWDSLFHPFDRHISQIERPERSQRTESS